jgi:hypothetical protein
VSVLQVFLRILLHFYLQLDLPLLGLPEKLHIVSWSLGLDLCPGVLWKLREVWKSERVELEYGWILIGNF